MPDRIRFVAASWWRLANWLSRRGITLFQVSVLERGRAVKLPLRLNGTDCRVAKELFLNRPYDVPVEHAETILDLGGNIGLATLLFHVRFPNATIAVVEPVPNNVSVLKETIRVNNIPATLFEAVVGTEDGSARLFVSADPTTSSITPSSAVRNGSDVRDEITVEQLSVPTLMKKMGWNRIDLLKVDIEGYEKILLSSKNDWLRSVNFIVGEAHAHVDYRLDDVIRDLAPFGFRVTEKSRDPVYGMIIFEACKVR